MQPFDFVKSKQELSERYPDVSERDVVSAALYPQVTDEYLSFREQYGPVDKLDTRIFLVGPKVGEEFEVSSRNSL
jgi:pyruvate carboxylase